MAIKKKRQAKKSDVNVTARELASDATVARCRVRAAALLQVSCVSVVQVSCNKVREMRYGPHATRDDRARPRPLAGPAVHPSGPSIDARRQANRQSRHRQFDLPLQTVDLQQLGNNTIQHRSNGMGFHSVNPATGGGGGRAWLTGDDSDALAPSDFFSPTGPLRTGLRTRRHAMLHLACVIGRASVSSFVL